jgi:hypothetical protein
MATLALVPETGEIPGLTPALTDIVGQLRDMANYYEEESKKGDANDHLFPKALLILKVYGDGEVRMNNVGERLNKFEIVGVLDLAGRRFDPEAGDASRAGPNAT